MESTSSSKRGGWSDSPISYAPHPDATPEAEQARDARARALLFVLDCHAKKEAAPESRPEDAKERFKNDNRAEKQHTTQAA